MNEKTPEELIKQCADLEAEIISKKLEISDIEEELQDHLQSFAMRKGSMSMTNQYYTYQWLPDQFVLRLYSTMDNSLDSSGLFDHTDLFDHISEQKKMKLAYEAVSQYTDEEQLKALYKVLDERFG